MERLCHAGPDRLVGTAAGAGPADGDRHLWPVEVILHGHLLKGVKQELQIHRQCEELLLDPLPEAAVARYLAARCVHKRLSPEAIRRLARTIYQRTDGHPLFMVTVVDYAEQQGWFTAPSDRWDGQAGPTALARQVPASLRQMIERQLGQLSTAERSVLEAASVVRHDFTTAAVAAGTQGEVEEVEQQCEELARRGQFFLSSGIEEWPDGTAAGRYRFRHILYQQVVSERLPVGQRMRLHQRVGERQEAGYGGRAHERAVELAGHFEQGRDYARAVWYRRLAAENAMRRWAYHEAIDHLTSGLELLNRLPDTPDRARQELDCQTALGLAVMVTKGFAAPEVGTVYARAADSVNRSARRRSCSRYCGSCDSGIACVGRHRPPMSWQSSSSASPGECMIRTSCCKPTLPSGTPCTIAANRSPLAAIWSRR